MIIASIDIGSNTVLMLIASVEKQTGNISTLANFYNTPRISKGLKYGSPIPENKIENLIKILNEYQDICKQYQVDEILVVATNALRIAQNAKFIIKKIKEETGLNIDVIDGQKEAQLSFLGSALPIKKGEEKTVIDIGGGSTEIIYGNEHKLIYKNSFNIGVVSLTEKYFANNKITNTDIKLAESFSNNTFARLNKNIPFGMETIAVAGTPTTLSCIVQNIKEYDENLVDNSILTYQQLCEIIEAITPLSVQGMFENYGQIVQGREDVLLAGCIILKTIMDELKLQRVIVSSKGLRYGVVLDSLSKYFNK